MALRPFITAGVAFAAAGAVAATVAIAPPMSPGEVKVAQQTEVDLNANLTDLINTYFGEFPGDPDNAGTIGVQGVIQQLLQNANVNDPRGTQVIDSFFEEGLSDVVRLLLTRDNLDPISKDQINIYFDGGLGELVRYRLLLFNADQTQRQYINKFFGGAVNDDGGPNNAQEGFPGVFYKWLSGTGLSAQQQETLDIFFNRGQILTEPDPEDPNGPEIPVIVDGEPVYIGNSDPAYRGFPGLIYRQIVTSGLTQDQLDTVNQFWSGGVQKVVEERLVASTGDPVQRATIRQYFNGGIDEVIKQRLLASGDANADNLTNEFFDNGIAGVVRYLLVGPVPEVESPPVPPTTPPPVNTLVANVEESTTAETQLAATVEETQQPADEPVAPQARKVEAAPAAAPATAPVESTSAVKQEAVSEVEADAEVKDGNKVEPVIIIPGGGGSSDGVRGGGAWGVFKPAFAAVDSMIKGGKTPAGGGTTTGGTTDGGATDGADNDGGGDGE
jgi:hypothetical protein